MVQNDSQGGWLASLSHYGAWFVGSLLALVDMLAVREAILALLSWYSVAEQSAYHQRGGVGQDIFTQFGISAADNVVLLVLGCGVVATVVIIEAYFRKGRAKGLLYKRIGKVLLIEVLIIVVAIVIRQGVSMILSASGA